MGPPQTVLTRFEFARRELRWQTAPPGLSGAEVWRGEVDGQSLFALKAWPEGYSATRLAGIHRWMTRAAHLPFVPRVLPALDGSSVIFESGRLWDVTRWMPGSPREKPTLLEIGAACAAVAQLHSSWKTDSRYEPCRGIRNRLQLLRGWMAAPHVDLASSFALRLKTLVSHAAALITRAAPRAIAALEPWEDRPVRIQPCLRDLRGEHVLFTGGEVAGIVDYGAMAEDHPAMDLARLLGDFSWETEFPTATAVAGYRAGGCTLEPLDAMVDELTRTGLLGSAIHWLQRLGNPGRWPVAREPIEARFALLVERIERFTLTG